MDKKIFTLTHLLSNQMEKIHHKIEFEKHLNTYQHDCLNSKALNLVKVNKLIFEKLITIQIIKKTIKKLVKPNSEINNFKNYINAKTENKIKHLERRYQNYRDKVSSSSDSKKYDLKNDVILSLRDVSINFGGLKALDKISFDVKRGEIFGLIGPNGAGKTTLFNCITQFYKPTNGEIIYRKRDGLVINLNDYRVHDIVNKGIVRTFQNLELVSDLTVLENILIAAHRQYNTGLFHHALKTPKLRLEERILKNKAEKILKTLGLDQLKDTPPIGLPYGVLKRIELARTLMADAQLIILDEPAAGLNDEETKELETLIKKINKEFDVTIFLVEHDMGLVMNICDQVCTISFGKKIAFGTPSEIQNNKEVREAYLGSEVK